VRKPHSDTPTPAKKAPAESDEPAGGRALQRARQFALQRGFPAPDATPPEAQPKPASKRPARKKT
jgi:hypothetical protein